MSTDEQIEQEIKAKGLTAPRVTMDNIEDEIASEHYFTAIHGAERAAEAMSDGGSRYRGDWDVPRSIAALKCLTFCVLVLRNGFTVTGESACASPKNYNEALGRQIARQHAIDKVWPLLGFRLRDQLAQPVLTEADALADLRGEPRPA